MNRMNRLLQAVSTILLAVVRVIIRPQWTREFIASVYSFRPIPYSNTISRIRLQDAVPNSENLCVTLRKCFLQHGNMTGEEIIAIGLLVRWKRPKRVFEFGTFNGNTTFQIALNADSDCRIETLNLPLGHGETVLVSSEQDKMVHPKSMGLELVFSGEPEAERIHQWYGDSATFDFSPFYGQFEFVLVDAGHEYEYVKFDTRNALKLLTKNGGLIVWHDFPNAPGVVAWLEELSRKIRIVHINNTRLAFSEIEAESLENIVW